MDVAEPRTHMTGATRSSAGTRVPSGAHSPGEHNTVIVRSGRARVAPERAPSPPRRTSHRPLRQRLGRFVRTPKGYLLLAFLVLGGLALPAAGPWRALSRTGGAAAVAAVVDLAFVRWRRGRWGVSVGAVLSGMIVAYVLGVAEPLYVPLVASAVALLSKHLVRTRYGPIFNPAALALLVAVLAFGSGESWWGALGDLPAEGVVVLLVAGVFVVERVGKLPLVLAFLGTYFGGFTVASAVNPAPVAEMFREPFVHAALFLGCFMLTDPPTSPGPVRHQVLYGAFVAAVACAAQLLGIGQTYLLVGLLAGNMALAGRLAWHPRPPVPAIPLSLARKRATALAQ